MAAAGKGWASPEPRLSLDVALRAALEHSPALAGRVVDMRVADDRLVEATGLDDLVLAGSGAWTHTRGPNIAAQATPLLPFDSLDLNLSLTRPLSTGGSVALTLDAPFLRAASASTHTGATGTGPVVFGCMPSAQISIVQPLLRGRGYNVARAAIRQGMADRATSRLELESAATLLLRDVEVAYWELAYAAGEEDLRKASLRGAQEQWKAVLAQIEVGKQPPSASAEVEVSVALRRDAVLDSEKNVTRRSAELRRLMGEQSSAASTLSTSDAPQLRNRPTQAARRRALDDNPGLLALSAAVRAASIQVDVADDALRPRLDVFAAGGPMGVAADAATAMRMLGALGAFTTQVGLTFQEPIERRTERGARDVAIDRVAVARYEEEDARAAVASAVAEVFALLGTTQERVELLSQAVKVAEADLSGEQARFRAGRSTSFDVLRRQQAVTDVKLRALRSRVDNAQAAATLDALTDDLLARHGLALTLQVAP